MSYAIETLNRGKDENFGFYGPDVTRVRLGELPSVSLAQFCDFATNTLIAYLDGADSGQRETIAKIVDEAIERVKDLPIKPVSSLLQSLPIVRAKDEPDFATQFEEALETKNADRLSELGDMLMVKINIAEGQEPLNYEENPFKIIGSTVVIGEYYHVDAEEFAYFTTYILTGGWFGWDQRGIPVGAHTNLEKLSQTVKIMTQ